MDDFKEFESTFEATRGYKDFTFEFDKQVGGNRSYRVEYDVWIQVPRNALFDSRTKALSSFDGNLRQDDVVGIVMDDLKKYYVVPEQALSAIEEFIGSRSIDELIDPNFVGGLSGYVRDVQKVKLEPRPSQPMHKDVWRHFKHDILMILEHGDWKIRSGLNNPVISLYP
jgi:hypothetical protein